MKRFLFLLLLVFTTDLFAADKVYSIKQSSPEISIGDDANQEVKGSNHLIRPSELWNVGIVRSSLNYHLPSFAGNLLDFSPSFVGLIIGRKIKNQFFLYKGFYEFSGEWQRFNREFVFSQKLDLLQINLFQNFNIAWALKHSVLFSVGVGISPLYLASEQSVLGNSTSVLGYMGMLKANIIIPLKKPQFEIDLSLKSGWGNAGGHEVSTTAIGLGVNFE